MKTLLIAFACLLASPAWADVFTIGNIPVEAEGDTAIQAQTTAILEGQRRAAELLMQRLAADPDQALPDIDSETATRMIRAMEIANERRSANRYLGDITVAFVPERFRELADANGVRLFTSQAQTRLVVPVIDGFVAYQDSPFVAALSAPDLAARLTPLQPWRLPPGAPVPSGLEAGDIEAVRIVADDTRASQVLLLSTTTSASGVTLRAQDINVASGEARTLRTASGTTYAQALDRLISRLEAEWKSTAAVQSDVRVVTSANILYRDLREWLRLRDAVSTSAQIQDSRLDALSKTGAQMTLVYRGDIEALRRELAFKGADVSQEASGLVIAPSGYVAAVQPDANTVPMTVPIGPTP